MYPTTFGKFVDPSTVVTHFHLREGDTVADFGAGSGHYMSLLSVAVGQEGAVYLCEIQKELVNALLNKSRDERLTNVHPLWCDIEAENGIKLKNDALDAGVLSNTLFQFTDKVDALKEIARVMRKGGKLFIIDWTDSFGGLGPQTSAVVTPEMAKVLIEQAGFTFEHEFPTGDHHYGLLCRKK